MNTIFHNVIFHNQLKFKQQQQIIIQLYIYKDFGKR
jgi:hypothetical protein